MICKGCGAELPTPKRASGRRRQWCSESCRKRYSYCGTCIDCGAPTAYSGQAHASPRCVSCGNAKAGSNRKVWTQAAIVQAFQQWVVEHDGQVPRTFDWNPTVARARGLGPHRDYLRSPDRWPHFNTVLREFGSWRAGVLEAGLTPRNRGESLSAASCKTPGKQIDPATAATARGHGNQEGTPGLHYARHTPAGGRSTYPNDGGAQ